MTDERRLMSREDVQRLIDDLWRDKGWLSIEDSAAKGELVIRLAALPDAALPQPATEPALDALPRLRLTGEQLDQIDPDPEKRCYVDWDEYDEFVRLDDVRRLAAQPSAEVERLNRDMLAGVLFALGYDLPGKRANEIAEAYSRAAPAESDHA